MCSGVRSSKRIPLALITIRSSPGTRAERLPLVQATRPWRGSSRCSSHTSARRSITDELPGALERVHAVVAAAAEVVVQAHVVGVELVVGVRGRRLGLIGGAN